MCVLVCVLPWADEQITALPDESLEMSFSSAHSQSLFLFTPTVRLCWEEFGDIHIKTHRYDIGDMR